MKYLLLLPLLLPALSALITGIWSSKKDRAYSIALFFSAANLVVSVGVMLGLLQAGGTLSSLTVFESMIWKTEYVLRADILSGFLLFLLSFTMLCALLAGKEKLLMHRSRLLIFQVMHAALSGAFLSHGLSQFLWFLYATIFPATLLIGWDSSQYRFDAAKRNTLQKILAALAFSAIVFLNASPGVFPSGMDWFQISNSEYVMNKNGLQAVLFLAFFLLQTNIFPFHAPWNGILRLKELDQLVLLLLQSILGCYALIRFGKTYFHAELLQFRPVIWVIGVLSLYYASISLLRAWSLRDFAAYAYQAVAAIFIFGYFSGGKQGFVAAGGILFFLSLSMPILMALIVAQERRSRSFQIGDFQNSPGFGSLYLALQFSFLGLPSSFAFYSFFYAFWALWSEAPWMAAAAFMGIPFLLLAMARGILQKSSTENQGASFMELNNLEKVTLYPGLVILLLSLAFPGIFFDPLSHLSSDLAIVFQGEAK